MRDDSFKERVLKQLDRIETSDFDELALFRLNNLKKTIFKKFLGSPLESQSLEDEALQKFLLNNDKISSLEIDCTTDLFRYVKDELAVLFDCNNPSFTFDLDSVVQYGYCGPGSSVGTRHCDFLNKMFNSTLTTTSFALYRHYADILSERWLHAESIRLRNHSLEHVTGSRISTVPKDDLKRRTICTEPILNMFYQLGAKTLIEDLLRKHHNIDVKKQPEINKSMARQGSIDRSFSTIDLSDASDCISYKLMSQLLPPTVFSTLDRVRSSVTRVKGQEVKLGMMSTMGNGFTFPLMTSFLSSVIRAVYRINGVHPKAGINYSVFGDDIICLTPLYDQVIGALTSFGFSPNMSKSFSEGFFRESCGGDYLHGFNVRGVYIKGLNNEADFYSSFNRLLRWSVDSGIDIPHVLCCFLENVSFRFVPMYSNNNEGIISTRFYASDYPRDSNGSISFKRLVPKDSGYRVTDRHPNPHGALIAFIGGYIDGWRGQRVGIRLKNVTYKVKRGISPNWDVGIDNVLADSYCQEVCRVLRQSLDCWTLARLEGLLK